MEKMRASAGTGPSDSDTISSRQGPAGAEARSTWFVRSAMVSVAAVNSGGDCIKPIGRTSENQGETNELRLTWCRQNHHT
jgi:hypothetical protein